MIKRLRVFGTNSFVVEFVLVVTCFWDIVEFVLVFTKISSESVVTLIVFE